MKTKTKRKLAAIIFPERCPFCGKAVAPCRPACEDCTALLPPCTYKKLISGIYEAQSALPYEKAYKSAILKVKFGKRKQYIYQLAMLTLNRIAPQKNLSGFDVVTFVPLHPDSQKERGFNQSELLAKYIAEELNIPCEPLLKKVKKNKPQHTLPASARQKNVMDAYRKVKSAHIKGRKILLVDDIVTTGFTLAECAKVLTEKGAEDICFLTFAISMPKTT